MVCCMLLESRFLQLYARAVHSHLWCQALLGQEQESYPLSQLLEWITERAGILEAHALINRILRSNICCKGKGGKNCTTDQPYRYEHWKNRLLGFDSLNAIGIIDREFFKSYPASYPRTSYFGRLSTVSSHIIIFAGVEDVVSKINSPGTAAQTRMVRIINQTAVIFSTIDSIQFYLPI